MKQIQRYLLVWVEFERPLKYSNGWINLIIGVILLPSYISESPFIAFHCTKVFLPDEHAYLPDLLLFEHWLL